MSRGVQLLRLPSWPVERMLALEEALLRHSTENWCIVNALSATSRPAVVMGIGGKTDLLCEMATIQKDNVDVYRRFTGGGTVVVGAGTVFASMIFNFDALQCDAFPRAIMDWSESLYSPVFDRLLRSGSSQSLSLVENDYVLFGDRKIGGNAQRVSKRRWVHHTSFLWDYEPRNMTYLQLPKKRSCDL